MSPPANIDRPAWANDDGAVIEATLELAAERCEDLTPLVFDRFFAQMPDARRFFELDDIDPRARGRMLSEIIGLIRDGARGEDYVLPTMATIAADHVSYGVHGGAPYIAFMDALRAVLEDLLGKCWTAEMAESWQRQSANLLKSVFHAG